MRTIVAILGCLGVGAISLALADPPAPAPDSSAAAAPTTTAAPVKPPPVTVNAAPEAPPKLSLKEQELVAQGYKLQMRNGERVFCRWEEQLGSRVNRQRVCGTAERLLAVQRSSKEAAELAAQRQMNPNENTTKPKGF